MMDVFVATPLGFEREAARELREVWAELLDASARPHAAALPEIREVEGGLELACEPGVAAQLNFFLKTANRVLLRLDVFRARDFPKLHERLKKIPLRNWIGAGSVRLEVAASGSRLNHERRIRETAEKAWALESDENATRRVYLRVTNDECTVSLDTSGEHLHRRGINLLRGEAPLRETIAAFCLRTMIGETTPGELRKVHLVDPFCGSGTLLIEAARLWRGNFAREYAFQTYGGFPKLFRLPNFERNYQPLAASPFASYAGFDLDPRMTDVSRRNASALGDEARALSFATEDLYAAPASDLPRPVWVICNPPYGERLAAPPAGEYLARIVEKYRPERWAVLLPEKDRRAALAVKAKVLAEIPLKNGGIPCRLFVWER